MDAASTADSGDELALLFNAYVSASISQFPHPVTPVTAWQAPVYGRVESDAGCS